MKRSAFIFALVLCSVCAEAQTEAGGQTAQRQHVFYLGAGAGFDYAGVGAKFEYLPVKNFGIFGALGYNFSSVGGDVGVAWKVMPDKKVSFNPMLIYGYNGALKVTGASQYDAISYGVSIGANLDITLGKKSNKLSVGLFVPFRSKEFNDKYNAAKANPNIKFDTPLLPVNFSVGYNFLL
ncbi:MAG: hypothetical protein LBH06_00940 [Rikenellaceae bacterium]|nr:hypothetical protein [Rikenellaceae bacterium]